MTKIDVPYFRPQCTDAEIEEVVSALRSGWLTTGPRVKRFEEEFAAAVGAPHAMAVNSCTAALHLAVEALGLQPGQAVLVPTMTFAATAEVVRYMGAIPVLVDCDPVTLNMDLEDAARKLDALRSGRFTPRCPRGPAGGRHHPGPRRRADDGHATRSRPSRRAHGLWVVEDAAHAFPAAWRPSPDRGLAAVRRGHRGGHLLLLLRQQDDHHGRGRHGDDRRRGPGRAHAAACRCTACRTTPGSATRAAGAGTTGSSPRASSTT